jgi:hypothetical protein
MMAVAPQAPVQAIGGIIVCSCGSPDRSVWAIAAACRHERLAHRAVGLGPDGHSRVPEARGLRQPCLYTLIPGTVAVCRPAAPRLLFPPTAPHCPDREQGAFEYDSILTGHWNGISDDELDVVMETATVTAPAIIAVAVSEAVPSIMRRALRHQTIQRLPPPSYFL